MDVSFWIKLGASFIVGSLWVTLSTLSSERFGSKVGGLIGAFPSTVVIALLFIGLTQSPQVAAQATTVMPLAQGLNGIFVLTFMILARRGMWTALISAVLVWILESSLLYVLNIHAFWISIAGWLGLFAFCYWYLEKQMKIPSQGKIEVAYSNFQIIWRALFGGSVIAAAVLMGKLGGPTLGGIFGSFPAMFLSNLMITYISGGPEFSRSVGKSLLISGTINVPLYEIEIRMLYPAIGLGYGTLTALLLTLGTTYLTFLFIKHRMG
ncbi:MAG TPA: DUF3147 family protein [Anaerolineales bacterium]|nr:DUF3147 family protein [Anaerolineales bacterium]